ncbi:DUF4183 domain-containing protein [Cytobacillus depressus]|uniref:DUF4183 domain-containing protein n=1 Tax=Cytobacillus depressus TaxID=1602942 RepID=UPI0014788699
MTPSICVFATLKSGDSGTSLDIPAASFILDDGNHTTALPKLSSGNSYYHVFNNGVFQPPIVYTVTKGFLTILISS